jgi:hypothetical protein
MFDGNAQISNVIIIRVSFFIQQWSREHINILCDGRVRKNDIITINVNNLCYKRVLTSQILGGRKGRALQAAPSPPRSL